MIKELKKIKIYDIIKIQAVIEVENIKIKVYF